MRLFALLFVLTAFGCTDTAFLDDRITGTIGADGGELRSGDGKLTLAFSAGAVSAPTQIVVEIDQHYPRAVLGT